jgi:hypothetical protein
MIYYSKKAILGLCLLMKNIFPMWIGVFKLFVLLILSIQYLNQDINQPFKKKGEEDVNLLQKLKI